MRDVCFVLTTLIILSGAAINGYNYAKNIDRSITRLFLFIVPLTVAIYLILKKFAILPITQ